MKRARHHITIGTTAINTMCYDALSVYGCQCVVFGACAYRHTIHTMNIDCGLCRSYIPCTGYVCIGCIACTNRTVALIQCIPTEKLGMRRATIYANITYKRSSVEWNGNGFFGSSQTVM